MYIIYMYICMYMYVCICKYVCIQPLAEECYKLLDKEVYKNEGKESGAKGQVGARENRRGGADTPSGQD